MEDKCMIFTSKKISVVSVLLSKLNSNEVGLDQMRMGEKCYVGNEYFHFHVSIFRKICSGAKSNINWWDSDAEVLITFCCKNLEQ